MILMEDTVPTPLCTECGLSLFVCDDTGHFNNPVNIDRLTKWRAERRVIEAEKDFAPRRLYDDEQPDGFMESDRDYAENNMELVVAYLEYLELKREE